MAHEVRVAFPTQARGQLEAAGVVFYDNVDVSGLYARIPPSAVATLERLVAEGLVRTVIDIPSQARLSPELSGPAIASTDAPLDITLLTFDEPSPEQLAELSRWLAIGRRSDGPVHILEGKILPRLLTALSELGYVRWIERQPEYKLDNLDGGMGIGADVVRDAGFDGTGIHVMVVDTGIARSGTTYHPDLLAGRILDQYDYQNGDSNAADDHSHGTHTAGTIGGLYNPSDPNSLQSWQGVAPGVGFYIYKLCCGTNQFSSTWFQQALQRGTSDGRTTHISSNSWGGGNGIYSTSSEIADRAVRGEYNGQYINMVISSGNDASLTSAPGTGKNVITVGSVKDGNYPDTPFDYCGTTAEYDWPPGERVCYSNYGPVDIDGDLRYRMKPDVMAPGAMTFSTAPWYLYGDSRYYQFKHGTSMAAPHVSGALAQILDAHSVSNAWLFSWPETVKAMLMATTVDVGGNTDYYGRGMVNPYFSIYYQPGVTSSLSFWGNSLASTGDTMDFTYNVPSGYQQVRVVLTWPDPAGSTEVSNDLDIFEVHDADGTYCGGSANYDQTVEYVVTNNTCDPGNWTITVNAFSLSSSQTFGLAAVAILADASLSESSSVEYIPSSDLSVDGGDYFYFHQYASNSGFVAGGSYLRLYVPSGFTVQGVRIYTNDGHSHYYLQDEIYHPSGSSYWRVAVGDVLAGFTRHVRWFIQADSGAQCGHRGFDSDVYWRQAGNLLWGGLHTITVKVTCKNYLPVVHR